MPIAGPWLLGGVVLVVRGAPAAGVARVTRSANREPSWVTVAAPSRVRAVAGARAGRNCAVAAR